MRKFNFLAALIFFALVAMLSGCSREDLNPESAQPILLGSSDCPSRAEFVAGKDYREYIVAYRQLAPTKKKCMWEDKMAHSLQFFTNEGQRNFIVKASQDITLTRFENGNPQGYEESFINEAKTYFTFEQIANLFFVLHDYDNPPSPMRPNAAGSNSGSDCECFYDIYCGLFGVCARGNCNITNGGCGVFGSTNCKGKCEL